MASKYKIGDVLINKWEDKATIIGFHVGSKTRARSYSLQFTDGTIINVSSSKLNVLNWKNPNKISIFGVGFIGKGDYKSAHKNQSTRAYSRWYSMLSRCYNKKMSVL